MQQQADATSGSSGNGKRRRSLSSIFRRDNKPAATRTGSTGTAADADSKKSAVAEPVAATQHGGGRRPAAGSTSTTAAIAASADGRKKKGGVTTGVNSNDKTKRTRNSNSNNSDKAKTPFRRGSLESLPSVCLSSASSSPFQSAHSDQSSGAGTCSAGSALSHTCTTSKLNNQTEAAAATAEATRADQAEAATADTTAHADHQTQTPDAAAEAKAALSALSLQPPQVRQPTTTSAVDPAPTHAASDSESGHFTRHHHSDPDPDPNHQSLRPPPPLPPIPAKQRRRRRASASTSTSAPPAEGTAAETSRQQKQKEHEFHVDFHPMVMFATVPPKAELSDEERSAMFWTVSSSEVGIIISYMLFITNSTNTNLPTLSTTRAGRGRVQHPTDTQETDTDHQGPPRAAAQPPAQRRYPHQQCYHRHRRWPPRRSSCTHPQSERHRGGGRTHPPFLLPRVGALPHPPGGAPAPDGPAEVGPPGRPRPAAVAAGPVQRRSHGRRLVYRLHIRRGDQSQPGGGPREGRQG